ncbi:MAG TPA: hypothetical protein VFE62_17155 [Gemmataceae bacterium]|nr:hypothetical protein [Gemmataceae bacterium]
MNLSSHIGADPMQRLERRIRWKRFLTRLHRFTWFVVLAVLLLFGIDFLVGLRTLTLRVASGALAVSSIAILCVDLIASWLMRLDRLGIAHVLEQQYPDLAERLVTLVQMPAEQTSGGLGQMLHAQTSEALASLDPTAACSLKCEGRRWCITACLLVPLLASLAWMTSFGPFSQRLLGAWWTPLVPYEIGVTGNGYALRGSDYPITATVRLLDANAQLPTECRLIGTDAAGVAISLPLQPDGAGQFACTLGNVQRSLHFYIAAGEARSESMDLGLVDAPAFAEKPAILVLPPPYAEKNVPITDLLDEAKGPDAEVLRFSKMHFRLPVKDYAGNATLRVKSVHEAGERRYPVRWNPEGAATVIADEVGVLQADLILQLDHGLTATLPVGQFTVRDDHAPRFTRSPRLAGSDAPLQANVGYRVAADAFVKLQGEIEDDEGLDAVALELRINDAPPQVFERWLNAGGRSKFAFDNWLPLPSTLKEGDRVQFRVRASDNRRIAKGSIDGTLPVANLGPHVIAAPAGEDAWIEFRVDASGEDLLKQSAQKQAEDVKGIVAKLKQMVQSEAEQAGQLQRTIHQQAVLTPLQVQQAERLQALDRDITTELFKAGQNFLANPELAGLAEHFFDIADNEMSKSSDALKRFRDRGRTLMEAEHDLQAAQDALKAAGKKLDRLLDWNAMLAQDRLDRWQMEKLAKRQDELANRLEKMLAEAPLSDAERARQIEAIRQEQAKLAEQTEKLQDQSRLVKESEKAAEQMRLERLAKEAEAVAAEQRAQRDLPPEKMSPEIKARLAKLAQRQADLAERSMPFAKVNQGPDAKPAQHAADALKKPKLGEALAHQQEHELRMREWLGKLLPGVAVNALREQVLQLAKQQQAIRADLDKLGQDFSRLDEKTLQGRLRELVNRQKALHGATAKLPVDAKLRAPHANATQTVEKAASQLAAKDALQAFESMEQAEQQLRALASLMPNTLPADRNAIKDVAMRDRIDKVEKFEAEQKKLREETEKLLADWMKASAGHGSGAMKEKTEKLSADLLELAQKGEAKAMAKESAEALDMAKKAMAASDELKAKGAVDEAKKMDDAAEKQLDLVFKQVAKLAQDQKATGMPKADAEKTAEAVKLSAKEMRKAEQELPRMPKDAQTAMKSAAQKLNDAAQQATKQSARNLPRPMRDPAKGSNSAKGSASGLVQLDKLEKLNSKAWGELPGELKTQMIQDFRARYGAEYAEVIRQYFERLANEPRPSPSAR